MNRRKAFLFLLIVGLAVLMICSPVSAEVFSKTYEDSSYNYWQSYYSASDSIDDFTYYSSKYVLYFLSSWQSYDGLDYIGGETSNYVTWSGSDTNTVGVQLKQGSKTYASGSITVIKQYNPDTGTYSGLKYWMFLDDFDTESLQNDNPNIRYLEIVPDGYTFNIPNGYYVRYTQTSTVPSGISYNSENGEAPRVISCLRVQSPSYVQRMIPGTFFNVISLHPEYKLTINSEWTPNTVNMISIDSFSDIIRVTGYSDDNLMFNSYESGEREFPYHLLPLNVTSYLPDGTVVSDIIGEGVTPTTGKASVITRVKSLADNSLIAGSKAYYRSLDGSDLVNKTLPSGSDVFLLQKNVEYEFWAEASGYGNQTVNPSSISFSGDSQNDILLVPTLEDPDEGTGLYNFYISEQTNAVGSSTPLTSPATVVLNGETKLTTSAGYVSFEVNKTVPITYKITKSGYESVSRTYTPNWPGNSINDFITLRPEGVVLPGDPTPTPGETPPTSSDIPAHRQAAHESMEELNGIIPGIVSMVAIMFLVAVMKRGMK